MVGEQVEPGAGQSTDRSREQARADDELRRRIGSAGDVTVRLAGVDETSGEMPHRHWDGLAGALVRGDQRISLERPYAVLGGPGTGKSSLLVDTMVDYLRAGGRAEEIMVVTPSKEAATSLREQLMAVLRTEPNYAATATPVRSVHSWAFAVLRAVAQAQQDDTVALPRLMTGAEHDMQIRALLRGHAEDGTGAWPEDMRPALPLVGFARQLRDLLLRAAERGIGPDELCSLGRQHDEAMWVGAGEFLREYHQIQALSRSQNLNASELLHVTLDALDQAPAVLEHQSSRIRLLLVDDAHNLDPAAGAFLSRFIRPGVRTLVAGDPDQCVFHFRGADEEFLSRIAAEPDQRVVLSVSHRLPDTLVTAVNDLESRLPAAPTRVALRPGGDAAESAGAANGPGAEALQVRHSPSTTADHLAVTDEVRRAHVSENVPWDDIAVIVRSTGAIPALRRTLLSHGVPVTVDQTSVVLAEQPLVNVLLLALDALVRPLEPAEMQRLLESPVGGADPVMLRRVERAIAPVLAGTGMRAMEAVTLMVTGRADPAQAEAWSRRFGPREQTVIDRLTHVLDAGRSALGEATVTSPVEEVLWAVWQAADLSNSLQRQALRGGTLGSQADRDLDAVMSLFDLAGDVVERTPSATLETFLDEVRAQELPTGGRDRRGTRPDAVEILPAHAAAGRQWQVVVVAGVQEDSWPAGPTVGGLFGQQELVDWVDRGISPEIPVSRAAAALAEERRLFLLAISRATRRTLVTAVDASGDDMSVPSRFLAEITGETTGDPADSADGADGADGAVPAEENDPRRVPVTQTPALPRVLALEPLVAELRDAVCDPHRPGHERDAAASNLAHLAAAGVYGADPDHWWGTAEASATSLAAGTAVRISPTTLETMDDDGCDAVNFLIGLTGGASTEAMKVGVLIHAVAEGFAAGLTREEAHDIVTDSVPHLVDGPAWTAGPLLDSCLEAVDRLDDWIGERDTAAAASGRIVEVERKLEATIGETPDGLPVVLAGRTDRLEIDPDGHALVIDFKTGKTPKTKKEAADSAQLKAYQLLVAAQDNADDRTPAATPWLPDGAMLVYPRRVAASITVLQQPTLTEEQLAELREFAVSAANRIAGPIYRATTKDCEGTGRACLCPACRAGEQVV